MQKQNLYPNIEFSTGCVLSQRKILLYQSAGPGDEKERKRKKKTRDKTILALGTFLESAEYFIGNTMHLLLQGQ